jgi:ABC-type dipeptide/oligopeptide/nickel transport system permease subunit
MISIDIQGEEHHCREEHHRAIFLGIPDKYQQQIEMRVLMALGDILFAIASLALVVTIAALIGRNSSGVCVGARMT